MSKIVDMIAASPIGKLFAKDENGKQDRPKITLVIALCVLPIIIFEGVKVGIYGGYHPQMVGFQVLGAGLVTPFATVWQMKDQYAFATARTGFDAQYVLLFLLAWFGVSALFYINAERRQRISNVKDGDAKWQNIDEYNKIFAYPQKQKGAEDPEENSEEPGNMILSQRTRYALEPHGTNTYSCNLVVGSTGSGKSFGYVKPNILQMNSSFIVTDPKGELSADTGMALLRHGYDVKVFNVEPSELKYSCKYNPFAYVRSMSDIDSLVEVFINNRKEEDAKPDAFFDPAAKNFLCALFKYVYEVYKDTEPEKMTMKTVYELFLECKEAETDSRKGPAPKTSFSQKFEMLSKENEFSAAYGHFAIYDNGTAKTKQSILATVGNYFSFMNTAEIASLLSCDPVKHIRRGQDGGPYLIDDLRLDLIGDRKTALFVIIPSQEKVYNFLAAMMFSQLFRELYRIGNTVNAKSWILSKGMTTAFKSRPFIPGTEDEEKARNELEELRKVYLTAKIEVDDEETLPRNAEGIRVWPKARIVAENGTVLEEFLSKEQAELVLDAAKNGKVSRGRKSHVCHVRLIFDEFFAIGKIKDFDNIIATCRSLRISVDIILQSVVQLKEMYDDREGKITSNCSNVIMLAVNEIEDMKWFSDLVGQMTVVSESISLDHNGIGGASGGSLSENAQMMLRPDQLRRFNKDECLIVTSSQNPIKDKKYKATEHPRWCETKDSENSATFCNEFPYRRIFYIDQEDRNRVVTARPAAADTQLEDNASKATGRPSLTDGRQNGRHVRTPNDDHPLRDVVLAGEDANSRAYRARREALERERQEAHRSVHEAYHALKSRANENGDIKFSDLPPDLGNRIAAAVGAGVADIKDGRIVKKSVEEQAADAITDI